MTQCLGLSVDPKPTLIEQDRLSIQTIFYIVFVSTCKWT